VELSEQWEVDDIAIMDAGGSEKQCCLIEGGSVLACLRIVMQVHKKYGFVL